MDLQHWDPSGAPALPRGCLCVPGLCQQLCWKSSRQSPALSRALSTGEVSKDPSVLGKAGVWEHPLIGHSAPVLMLPFLGAFYL